MLQMNLNPNKWRRPRAESADAGTIRRNAFGPQTASGTAKETVNASEVRINLLKVLVLMLLREVESLDGQSTSQASCPMNLRAEVQRFEAEVIRSALARTGGRQRPAARLLGMKATTLNTKVRRYHIEQEEKP